MTGLILQHAEARHRAEHTRQSHEVLASAARQAWLNGVIDDAELDQILSAATGTATEARIEQH